MALFLLCMALSGKVLTWDSLQKGSQQGPGFCYLCRKARENIHHLLVNCHFVNDVWDAVKTLLGGEGIREGPAIDS